MSDELRAWVPIERVYPDTLYVVSSLVASAARDRNDLVIPDDLVRNDEGRIIGARGLAFEDLRSPRDARQVQPV